MEVSFEPLLVALALADYNADYKPWEQGYGSKTVSYLNEIVDKLNLTGMPSVTNAKEFAKAAMGQGRCKHILKITLEWLFTLHMQCARMLTLKNFCQGNSRLYLVSGALDVEIGPQVCNCELVSFAP